MWGGVTGRGKNGSDSRRREKGGGRMGDAVER